MRDLPKPLKLLVVDDIPQIGLIVKAVASRLTGFDVAVTHCTRPEDAIAELKRESFDIVFSDFRMPSIDGLQVLTQALATNPGARRVLMTGYNEIPADAERMRAAQVDVYVSKPFATSEMLELLHVLVSNDDERLGVHRAASRTIENQGEGAERGPAEATHAGGASHPSVERAALNIEGAPR